jgi:predicted permease
MNRHALLARLRLLFGREAEERMESEFRFHIDMAIAKHVAEGMDPEEARRRAAIEFGGGEKHREAMRDGRGLRWVESLFTDIRYAVRQLKGAPAYTLAVVVTLALGIGATAGMFTILNAVILRPLPFPNADRILSLSVASEGTDRQVVDEPDFRLWAAEARTLNEVSAYASGRYVIRTGSGPQEVIGMRATAPYFRVYGVGPLLGRVFTNEEDRPGGPAVIVLSEQLWRGEFDADTAIVGSTIVIDDAPATVIGVMPAAFTANNRALFWQPFQLRPAQPGSVYYYQTVARIREDASLDAVRAELMRLHARLELERAEGPLGLTPVVMTLHERRYGSSRRALVVLFAAVSVLLLITCANLANLALARGARRQREFSLRVALGAQRRRLARFVMLESLLLSVAGAALGLVIAWSSIGYFVRISPRAVANTESIGVNGTVLLFTLALTLLTTLLFGLLPAFGAARVDLSRAMKFATSRITPGHRVMRRSLVVIELATALVLVIAAGLVARTFWSVSSVPAGFVADGLLTAKLALPFRSYSDTTARQFMQELLARVRALPGVRVAALSDGLPLVGASMSITNTVDGKSGPRFDVVGITSQYMETVGTRIIAGRGFRPEDHRGGAGVAIVSAEFARVCFPGRSALGERLSAGTNEPEIVGVTEDIRMRELEGAPSLVAFRPLEQLVRWRYLTLTMRTSGGMAPLTRAVTSIVQDIDPTMAPPPFREMGEIVADEVAPRKFVLVLLSLFAGLAGALAAIGLYGVLAYFVAEQTRELGIRAALGADSGLVMRYMLGQGAKLTIAGLLLGLVGAFAAVRLLQTLVYGVGVHDRLTFVGGAVLLGAVAMVASVLPAFRAGRVDPVIALRAD